VEALCLNQYPVNDNTIVQLHQVFAHLFISPVKVKKVRRICNELCSGSTNADVVVDAGVDEVVIGRQAC